MNIAATRESSRRILLDGLADYIHLYPVDWNVRQHNPSTSRQEVQNETLAVIRSLVSEGLVVLGAMSEKAAVGRLGKSPSMHRCRRYPMCMSASTTTNINTMIGCHSFAQRSGSIGHFQMRYESAE